MLGLGGLRLLPSQCRNLHTKMVYLRSPTYLSGHFPTDGTTVHEIFYLVKENCYLNAGYLHGPLTSEVVDRS